MNQQYLPSLNFAAHVEKEIALCPRPCVYNVNTYIVCVCVHMPLGFCDVLCAHMYTPVRSGSRACAGTGAFLGCAFTIRHRVRALDYQNVCTRVLGCMFTCVYVPTYARLYMRGYTERMFLLIGILY